MNRKGFTLIELLIVVVIIGILAAIAIPKFSNTKEKAVRSSMISDLRNLATAQEAFYADSSKYASTIGATLGNGTVAFSLSKGNTATSMTGDAAGWAAELSNGGSGGKSCGIFVGTATPPNSGLKEGVADCY
jgi:type IV pilus assembly protein PilA